MSILSILLSVVAAASAQTPAASLTRIGAAAAVKGSVMAQSVGAVGRVMESGKPLFLNDHVTTDAAGRLQVMLLDETVFTVGANSDMVLDEFVYDPATSAGKVTARVTKGVFRFVTGKVARKDPSSMKVKLPVGTIGIRGTIAGGQVTPAGSTVILFGPGPSNNANENPGSVSVDNAGSQVVITQPGFGTTILSGQPPAGVTNMGPQAQQILGSLGEAPPMGGNSGAEGPLGAGGGSAAQQAGQTLAAGSGNASIAGTLGDFAGGLNQNQTLASQIAAAGSVADGMSTWDQVRSILTAGGSVFGSGTYTCGGTAGGSCFGGGSGTWAYQVDVNFANKTLGGGSSDIQLQSGPLNGASTPISTIQYGLPPYSLAPGGTAAALTLGAAASNSSFSSTVVRFLNSGGVAAKDLKVDLVYTAISDTAAGSITAPIPTR